MSRSWSKSTPLQVYFLKVRFFFSGSWSALKMRLLLVEIQNNKVKGNVKQSKKKNVQPTRRVAHLGISTHAPFNLCLDPPHLLQPSHCVCSIFFFATQELYQLLNFMVKFYFNRQILYLLQNQKIQHGQQHISPIMSTTIYTLSYILVYILVNQLLIKYNFCGKNGTFHLFGCRHVLAFPIKQVKFMKLLQCSHRWCNHWFQKRVIFLFSWNFRG